MNINTVYQEHIKDRDHTHLNATRWVTLTGLAKWMGRKGICHVEEGERGWYVTYIDRDPETLKRQESLKKNEKLDKDYEERIAKIIEGQIERGKELEKKSQSSGEASKEQEPTASTSREFTRSDPDSKVAFSLSIKSKSSTDASTSVPSTSTSTITSLTLPADKKSDSKKHSHSSSSSKKRKESEPVKKSALEELKEEQERIKAKKFRKDYWLAKGIVVKVVSKSLGDKYYKKKAVVKDVVEKYEGVIEMIDTSDRLRVDQSHVETVIPNVGRSVLVVNGPYAGSTASLLIVNYDKFSCNIKLDSGPYKGRVVEDIAYEDICKLASD